MGMLWLLLAYCLWITPLRAGAAVSLGPKGLPRASWGILAWGIRGARGQARMRRDAQGELRLETRRGRGGWRVRRPRPGSPRRGRGAGQWLHLIQSARETLRRGVRVRRLTIAVQAGGDAAWAALITGALRALDGVLPRAQVRCHPAFGGGSALRVHCIVETRLGTLWTAALLGFFIHRRRGRKEEGPWSILSDN